MTQGELKALLSYDPETGVFRRFGKVMGNETGTNGKKYLKAVVKGKKYRLHRLAWLYAYGSMPEYEVDHINGNGCDNRIANLRQVTRKENCRNKRKPKNNTTGAVGVYACRRSGKWLAQIRVDNKMRHLGTFTVFADAVNARKQGESFYGFHDRHGETRPL